MLTNDPTLRFTDPCLFATLSELFGDLPLTQPARPARPGRVSRQRTVRLPPVRVLAFPKRT